MKFTKGSYIGDNIVIELSQAVTDAQQTKDLSDDAVNATK